MTKFSAPQQNQLAQIGAFLRDNREKQSKSLEDIAIRTYIRPQLLNGIETGDPEMLPEPIFVQGFIRRYGEALGLNGVELSQQFTVTSIPSTPRPPRQAPPSDSPTTRLTRAAAVSSAGAMGSAAPPASETASSPMFSAGAMANTPDELTLGRAENVLAEEPAIAQDVTTTISSLDGSAEPAEVTPAVDVEEDFASKIAAFDQANLSSSGTDTFDSIPTNFSSAASVDEEPTPVETTTLSSLSETTLSEAPRTEISNESTLGSFELEDSRLPDVSDAENGLPDSAVESPVLSSLEANSLEANSLEANSLEANSPALNSQVALDSTLSNNTFDDDLPAAFTTQTDSLNPPATSAVTTIPTATPDPVGVEYDNYDQPNLKPFIIGGVVAAIATGAIILASVLGGVNRQPDAVADSTGATEQVIEDAADTLPALPEETTLPEPAEQSEVSSAPVYVEATATSEAWVSIILDGDPTPVFEGILQPGDSQVWEAQENISVYSGDAGALELAANGGEAEVMGDRGQPQEKIFPEE